MKTIVFICLLFLILLFVFFVCFKKINHNNNDNKGTLKRENLTSRFSFKIKNYLIGSPIVVTVENEKGEIEYTSKEIQGRKFLGVSETDKLSFFKGGNMIVIYTVDKGIKKLYSKLYIDTKKNEFIKSLHVGMITTRFTGSTDTFRQTVTASVAVDGQPWVKIHNLTDQTIRLNGRIEIPAHSATRYEGYLNRGVPLGTYFKDDTGIYSTFQYLQPHSDIYYGVVSDLQQSLQGPWQYGEEFTDNINPAQTLWPFQEGIL